MIYNIFTLWFGFGPSDRSTSPAPRTRHGGGLQFARIFAGAPYQASEGNVLRQRCDARGLKPPPIEIIARRKVAPAFEPQRDRRAGSPGTKRGHDTGPERGPSLHVQGSVWRSCGSSLTVGTQAPDDRMEGFDPELPFEIGPVNEREAQESGHWLGLRHLPTFEPHPRRVRMEREVRRRHETARLGSLPLRAKVG